MNDQLFSSHSAQENECELQVILTDWLQAITTFYSHYEQLTDCLQQADLVPVNSFYIGQCPIEQLADLPDKMQQALIKLTKDIDQIARRQYPTSRRRYKQLARHTQELNHLTYLAQMRLELARQSSS